MQEETDGAPTTEITPADIDSAPDRVDVSKQDTSVSADDLRAAFVKVSEEKEALQEELDETKKRVKTTEILDGLIEPYAGSAYRFMCIYSAIVGLFVLLHGLLEVKFSLPDGVLEFLVGSTAVTVFGLVGMVLTGIFVGARNNKH